MAALPGRRGRSPARRARAASAAGDGPSHEPRGLRMSRSRSSALCNSKFESRTSLSRSAAQGPASPWVCPAQAAPARPGLRVDCQCAKVPVLQVCMPVARGLRQSDFSQWRPPAPGSGPVPGPDYIRVLAARIADSRQAGLSLNLNLVKSTAPCARRPMSSSQASFQANRLLT